MRGGAFSGRRTGHVFLMTSTGFIGHIRIHPALNEAEWSHLFTLVESDGTLRGTPTGRGDREVPFARLAWELCSVGCCLTWNPELEASRMMLPSLRFLIDHLLRSGAKAQGRREFEEFTFDHVLEGAVMGRDHGDRDARLVEVTDNVVSERTLVPCDGAEKQRPQATGGRSRGRRLPSNVIEFRPRRA